MGAEVSGTTVTAELDTADNLKEVGASRSVTIGDRDVTVSPSFLVKAQTARVKLMTALGKDNLSVQADIDGTDLSAIEVEYERDLDDGRAHPRRQEPGGRGDRHQVRVGRDLDRQGERAARGRQHGRCGQADADARLVVVDTCTTQR